MDAFSDEFGHRSDVNCMTSMRQFFMSLPTVNVSEGGGVGGGASLELLHSRAH
jgi:hypothetical protein